MAAPSPVRRSRWTMRSGGLDFSKPPQSRLGVSKRLLYDGFFLFAVARQVEDIQYSIINVSCRPSGNV